MTLHKAGNLIKKHVRHHHYIDAFAITAQERDQIAHTCDFDDAASRFNDIEKRLPLSPLRSQSRDSMREPLSPSAMEAAHGEDGKALFNEPLPSFKSSNHNNTKKKNKRNPNNKRHARKTKRERDSKLLPKLLRGLIKHHADASLSPTIAASPVASPLYTPRHEEEAVSAPVCPATQHQHIESAILADALIRQEAQEVSRADVGEGDAAGLDGGCRDHVSDAQPDGAQEVRGVAGTHTQSQQQTTLPSTGSEAHLQEKQEGEKKERKKTVRQIEKEWPRLNPEQRMARVINHTYNEVLCSISVVFETRRDYWDVMSAEQRMLIQELESECWNLELRAEQIMERGYTDNAEVKEMQGYIWALKCDVLVHFAPMWRWNKPQLCLRRSPIFKLRSLATSTSGAKTSKNGHISDDSDVDVDVDEGVFSSANNSPLLVAASKNALQKKIAATVPSNKPLESGSEATVVIDRRRDLEDSFSTVVLETSDYESESDSDSESLASTTSASSSSSSSQVGAPYSAYSYSTTSFDSWLDM